MHLLDTDTLTLLHLDHPRVSQRFRECPDPAIHTTIITKIEILRGRFDFALKASGGEEILRAQALLLRAEDLLNQLTIIPFDEIAAAHFDRLGTQKKLKKLGRADLLIASIALAQQATLVTRNLRHFQSINGLDIVNWAD